MLIHVRLSAALRLFRSLLLRRLLLLRRSRSLRRSLPGVRGALRPRGLLVAAAAARIAGCAAPARFADAAAPAQTIVVLFSAVSLLLLLGCLNVAILVLARLITREKEFDIRLALGAGRGHLVRQIFAESGLLALAGGLGGLVAAEWAVSAVVRFGPQNVPATVQRCKRLA